MHEGTLDALIEWCKNHPNFGSKYKACVACLETSEKEGAPHHHFHVYVQLQKAPSQPARVYYSTIVFNGKQGNITKANDRTQNTTKFLQDYCKKDGNWKADGICVDSMLRSKKSKKGYAYEQIMKSGRITEEHFRDHPEILERVGPINEGLAEFRRVRAEQIARQRFQLPQHAYRYQAEVITSLREQPDGRSMHWIVDAAGNRGKSTLARFLRLRAGAVVFTGQLQYKDIAHTYDYEPVVVFDIPRSKDYDFLYPIVESFLDGYITSTKYRPVNKACNCHVIVFTNTYPDKEKLSQDRWARLKVLEPGDMEHVEWPDLQLHDSVQVDQELRNRAAADFADTDDSGAREERRSGEATDDRANIAQPIEPDEARRETTPLLADTQSSVPSSNLSSQETQDSFLDSGDEQSTYQGLEELLAEQAKQDAEHQPPGLLVQRSCRDAFDDEIRRRPRKRARLSKQARALLDLDATDDSDIE